MAPAGTGFDEPVRAPAFLTRAVPAQQSGGGRPPDRRLRTERSAASVWARNSGSGTSRTYRGKPAYVRFSNRPFGVKHFQTIHLCGVDVARGLALLFGIGTKALPSWDSKMRWNNLSGGLAVG